MIRLMLVVIVVLITALSIEAVRGGRARARGVRAALALDSAQAASDTSREIEVAALHDSVRVFVRRVQQQEQRADQLDRALESQRLARLNAHVRVAALDTVVRTDTVRVGPDSTRRSHFRVRQGPYTVEGDVVVDGSMLAGSVALRVDLDSIPLELRLSCGGGSSGVKQALVVAIAPPWAKIALASVEQSPTLCNPELAPPSARARVAGLFARAGVSMGASAVVERNGQVAIRPAIMLGIRIWP